MYTLKPLLFLLFYFIPFLSVGQNNTDTIVTLKNRTKAAFYKAPNGKIYPVKFIADSNEPISTQSAQCGEDEFSGIDRARAKTSFVNGVQVKSFASIAVLVASLTKDSEMKTKLNRTSPRITEEKINVRLRNKIFLYAMKKEGDNDYHVIIGDNRIKTQATFLNVEISGIPHTGNAANKAALQTVRDFFEDNFVELCGSKYAVFSAKPIPITIEGSIFFDVDHSAGTVGPNGFKPTTAWEIHPISKIGFQ
jgi:hypothetical protein